MGNTEDKSSSSHYQFAHHFDNFWRPGKNYIQKEKHFDHRRRQTINCPVFRQDYSSPYLHSDLVLIDYLAPKSTIILGPHNGSGYHTCLARHLWFRFRTPHSAEDLDVDSPECEETCIANLTSFPNNVRRLQGPNLPVLTT